MIKQGGTTSIYFTETDHLGSIVGLINADGSYAEQFSYDPWGRRRNPTNWTYSSVPQPVLITRGFTGHEHLDNFGLIDMNGRMYDPVLGRFLGVDPIIQAPDNSQSINGYGYCLNNPLSYVDPSGYSYYQTMKDLYIGTGYFSYRGGICSYGEDGWSYYQPTLGGGMAPAANLSYDALHQELYHYDQQGNLRDYNGAIIMTRSQVESEMKAKDEGDFDVDKAINNLNSNLHEESQGGCINHMVPALIEGGIIGLKGQPIKAARLYGQILKDLGFVTVDRSNGIYQRGDIAIFQGYPGGTSNSEGIPYGHIQMYDGQHWLSDFRQSRPFWPGSKYELYKPSYEILHWPY